MIESSTTLPAPASDPVPIVPQYEWQRSTSSPPMTLSFHDILHALNPLQHLPGVGMLYRAITHDDIPAPLKIAGSMVFGAAVGNLPGVFISVFANFAEGLMQLGPAVPGHVLQVNQWAGGSETGPSERPATTTPGVTYADGSTGSPTWTEGELTNFDMTVPQPPAGDAHARHVAAIQAYNRAVMAFEGISPSA
jgi:hypothetical protein